MRRVKEIRRAVEKKSRAILLSLCDKIRSFFMIKVCNYPISTDTLAHSFRLWRQSLAFFFFRLASSVLKGGGSERFASRRRSRETWEIASDSSFCPCLLLCIADCVSAFEPRRSLQREWREKLSFSPVYFSSPLSTSFSNVSHPEAIYLICFLMRQTKKIKNSSFSQATGTRSFIYEKRCCLLELKNIYV